MRLNHDCVRDILLYIEKNTTDELPFVDAEDLIINLKEYASDTINYHLRQIDKAGLVDGIFYADNVPQTVGDLSWDGRHYVDNIRDNNVWNKLKEISKNMASASLPVLVDKAPDVVKLFLNI